MAVIRNIDLVIGGFLPLACCAGIVIPIVFIAVLLNRRNKD